MTVCGNKLSGVCGACTLVNICRNNEIAKLPKSNIEWMREASMDELAEFLADKCNEVVDTVLSDASCDIDDVDNDDYWYRQADFVEWLKQPHTTIKE